MPYARSGKLENRTCFACLLRVGPIEWRDPISRAEGSHVVPPRLCPKFSEEYGGSQLWIPFGGPSNKDCSLLGPILGSPCLGTLPHTLENLTGFWGTCLPKVMFSILAAYLLSSIRSV